VILRGRGPPHHLLASMERRAGGVTVACPVLKSRAGVLEFGAASNLPARRSPDTNRDWLSGTGTRIERMGAGHQSTESVARGGSAAYSYLR
jgi:hypothetical protein